MADAALDPLDEVNAYTGESPNQQLAPMAGQTALDAYTRVQSDADYDRLAPGTEFVDPQGNRRRKPLPTVASDKDFDALPEGAEFLDPEGNTRKKPAYEGVGFTAQALHSMALNPKEQRKALEYSYPGAEITQDANGEWVVNDNGVQRKAGATRGVAPFAGAAAASAAPVIGSVLGAIGGGAAAAPTGPGAVAGMAVGGASGGAAGQMVNDAIFSLIAGSDRTAGEEAANLGLAGLSGGAGAGVGRGAAAFVPSIKAGMSAAGAALPGFGRFVAGARPEELVQASRLADRGYAVPPSAWAHEAPHVQNMVEVMDPAFRTNKPLHEQNYAAYERDAKQMLKDQGVPEFQVDDLVQAPSLTNPESAIPTAKVGEALRAKAMEQAAAADANLAKAFEERRAAVAAGAPDIEARNTALLRAQEESRRAVDNLLNENYQRINQDVDRAYAMSQTGANSGEAWQAVADRLRETRRAIGERASRMYAESHELGGNTPIANNTLVNAAREVAEALPEEFRASQPTVVRRLEALGGEMDAEGNWVREPTHPTFAELHELRTLMRTNADFSRLNSDTRNGVFKHFNNVIDDTLTRAGETEALRPAAEALERADRFYREQIPIFNSRELAAVMRGVEAGEPANPIALYKTLVDANQPQMTARIREMVGPNLWSAVQAAHVQDLMQRSMSKEVRGAIDGPAFARNVLADANSGLLQQVQDRAMSDQLLRQVDAIAMARGKMPLPATPGDRIVDVIAKARVAEEAAKREAVADPMTFMRKQAQQIDREAARAQSRLAAERKKDQLGFLFDTNVGTQEAADRILRNPDLLAVSAERFGRDSTEFKLLQQAYLWKVLKGDMNPGKELAKLSPEIQSLMFPGTTLEQLQMLAKDMDFLTNTRLMGRGAVGDTGGSMMARAKVEHPPRPGPLRNVVRAVPIAGAAADWVARTTLQKFYAIVAKATTQPALFRFMLKGLQGTPQEREAVRQALSAVLQRGGAMGAGAGEALYQNPR